MSACPSELELGRAVSDGAAPEHLAACASCRATWDDTLRAIELARRATRPLPPAAQREELRTAILASSRGAPVVRRRAAVVGCVALAAAGAALYLGLRPRPIAPPPARHATIVPHAGAQFSAASDRPDELVYLVDGGIDVAVTPLEPGERFRVVTVDAEVEVHGTAFEVTAHDRRLASVRVHHGTVEVRALGGPARLLHAGDAWAPPPVNTALAVPPSAPPPPAPAPAPAAPRHIAAQPLSPRAAPPPARSPQAIAYDDAWTALRANDFATASAAFARTTLLDPDGPLAEDASYWYPVALARAKRGEAAGAFRDFLDRYPRSPHAGEASAMLGWLLVDAGERAEAERRFRAGLDAASEQVRASARAGLAALGVR